MRRSAPCVGRACRSRPWRVPVVLGEVRKGLLRPPAGPVLRPAPSGEAPLALVQAARVGQAPREAAHFLRSQAVELLGQGPPGVEIRKGTRIARELAVQPRDEVAQQAL